MGRERDYHYKIALTSNRTGDTREKLFERAQTEVADIKSRGGDAYWRYAGSGNAYVYVTRTSSGGKPYSKPTKPITTVTKSTSQPSTYESKASGYGSIEVGKTPEATTVYVKKGEIPDTVSLSPGTTIVDTSKPVTQTYTYTGRPDKPQEPNVFKKPMIGNVFPYFSEIGEYHRSGHKVPEYVKEQVGLPSSLSGVEDPDRLERLYEQVAYEKYLGLSTNRGMNEIGTELSKSYWYMSTQPIYGEKGKTFSQVKKEEPALYLKKKKSGEYYLGYDYVKWRSEYEQDIENQFGAAPNIARNLSQSFLSIFDPGTWVAASEGKLKELQAQKLYYDVRDIKSGKGLEVWARVQAPAYENVILPLAGGVALGAGIGSLKATSIGAKTLITVGSKTLTVGGAVEKGIVGYGTYQVGKSLIENPKSTVAQLAISLPSSVIGYKAGYTFGYGRTEAFVYGRSTYTPGSPEYIRFKETIKLSRKLQYFDTKVGKPLNFTKDIMRLSPDVAKDVTGYLRSTSRTSVIGGSASSYAQTKPSIWFKYRSIKPRDIDLLVKDVGGARSVLGGKSHVIDIHGYEFGGKGGQYYRFGFVTQSPKRIGEFKYMRLSEQVFRKGVSSVTTETGYRWFKDIPDFRMAVEQLTSGKSRSWNPFTRLRVSSVSKSFDYTVNPSKSPGFGRSTGRIGSLFDRFVKPAPSPKTVRYSGGYVSYKYPSGSMSSYFPSIKLSNISVASYKYRASDIPSFKPFVYMPSSYRHSSATPSYRPPVTTTPGYTPPYKPPSYRPPVTTTPGYTPPYKPPSYKPPYKPPGYTPPYAPPPSYKPPKQIEESELLRPDQVFKTKTFGEKYKYREFKIRDISKDIRM